MGVGLGGAHDRNWLNKRQHGCRRLGGNALGKPCVTVMSSSLYTQVSISVLCLVSRRPCVC